MIFNDSIMQSLKFQIAVRLDIHQFPWRPEIVVAINHCPLPNLDKHTCSHPQRQKGCWKLDKWDEKMVTFS
jgi:hypothetical protein